MDVEPRFAIVAGDDEAKDQALSLSLKLQAPLVTPAETDFDFHLLVGSQGLSLKDLGADGFKPLEVDFGSGSDLQRRSQGKKLIAKAVKTKNRSATVWDVTAGLGRDAFVLAALGYQVTAYERSPLLGTLVIDALERAKMDEKIAKQMSGLNYQIGDSLQALSDDSLDMPDIIYMDPMFPGSNKTALPKKEMRMLRTLVGDDNDATELCELAINKARSKVVVKRPRHAPELLPGSAMCFEGKSIRFDVYLPGAT